MNGGANQSRVDTDHAEIRLDVMIALLLKSGMTPEADTRSSCMAKHFKPNFLVNVCY